MNLLTLDRDICEVAGVRVRTLTAGELIDLEAAMKEAGADARKLIAAQLVAYVCDEQGAPVLTQEQALQVVDLQKPARVKAILEAADKLNDADPESLRGN